MFLVNTATFGQFGFRALHLCSEKKKEKERSQDPHHHNMSYVATQYEWGRFSSPPVRYEVTSQLLREQQVSAMEARDALEQSAKYAMQAVLLRTDSDVSLGGRSRGGSPRHGGSTGSPKHGLRSPKHASPRNHSKGSSSPHHKTRGSGRHRAATSAGATPTSTIRGTNIQLGTGRYSALDDCCSSENDGPLDSCRTCSSGDDGLAASSNRPVCSTEFGVVAQQLIASHMQWLADQRGNMRSFVADLRDRLTLLQLEEDIATRRRAAGTSWETASGADEKQLLELSSRLRRSMDNDVDSEPHEFTHAADGRRLTCAERRALVHERDVMLKSILVDDRHEKLKLRRQHASSSVSD